MGPREAALSATALTLMLHHYEGLNLFLMLVMAHFVGDFGLQPDRMALEKCPHARGVLPWAWWMVAHAGIHGFLVAAVSGIPLLGLAEIVFHFCIDVGKCQRLYSIGFDQMLHILCKLLWVVILVVMSTPTLN